MAATGRGDPLILCYHAVSDTWPRVDAVGPAALERQLRHLLKQGYRPLTLSEAMASAGEGRTLAVTFDDAYRSILERGLPVLEKLGVPATIFVPTDYASEAAPITWSSLGGWVGTAHEHELRCMSWDEIRVLAEAGWEIGSHTCSHPKLTEIDSDRGAGELERSKLACEAEVGRRCAAVAYPFGLHDERVVGLAEAAGYAWGVTLGERLLGRVSREPLELSREGVYRTTRWPHFLAATSPFVRKLRSSCLYI
jgi:peptidoglycan/xylan/chitin deacetylase (PgdA/CDA1 family)